MVACGAHAKATWAGENLRGGLGPSVSEDGGVLELFSACSEPPVWADKGASPLEEGAWQGCSPSLAQVQHLTRSFLHHFCTGALVRKHSCAECTVLRGWWHCHEGAVLAHVPVAAGVLGLPSSPLGHCLAAPSPAQTLTPEGSEQFLVGFSAPEVEIVALWCSCCAGGSPAPASPVSWQETWAQLPRNLRELKLRHRELSAAELLSMGPCSACLGKEH